MINHIDRFREKLVSRQLCLGTGITFNDPAIVEALAPSVDFLWIDMEHNPMGIEAVIGHLIAARAGGAPALVRVPGSETSFLKRILDAGAEGVIVPQVRSVGEVRAVVSACRYPPVGNRGWGPRRPSEYGRRPAEQVIREANQRLFVAVQIENVEAMRELEQIVAVPGLDSVAIGPYDLSASLGVLGRIEHPDVQAAIAEIIRRGHDAGLSVGIGDEAAAESSIRWAKMGVDWIQLGCDFAYLTNSAFNLFSAVRSATARRTLDHPT